MPDCQPVLVYDCPMSDKAASKTLSPDELRTAVSRALVGLSSPTKPLSIQTEQLTPDQLAQVCQALDLDPGPVMQLSIVATQFGPQLVVWSYE